MARPLGKRGELFMSQISQQHPHFTPTTTQEENTITHQRYILGIAITCASKPMSYLCYMRR